MKVLRNLENIKNREEEGEDILVKEYLLGRSPSLPLKEKDRRLSKRKNLIYYQL